MLSLRLYKILAALHLVSAKKLKKAEQKRNYGIIAASAYFDAGWYLAHNEDVRNAGVDPVWHYLEHGWKEDRDCTPQFDGNEYLRRHIDVYKAGINPLVHYELVGKYEKEKAAPDISCDNSAARYNDINALKALIDRHKVISFDIFDTLLLRPYVRPVDLFEHLGRLNKIENFKDIRIKAEKEARKVNSGREDITIDDIYLQLPPECSFLKEKEMALEAKVLQPNKEMLQVFRYALKQRKKVIIASDMYLPVDFLNRMLRKNGFTGFDKLYVSSDVGKGKGKSLFSHIIKDLDENPQEILHIGDNLSCDYKKPVSLGMSAFYYRKVFDVFINRNIKAKSFWEKDKSFEASALLMSLAIFNHQNREITYWRRFGFEYGGPVCYWYLQWIERQIKGKKIDDIIFVARDGYTLEKIFRLFGHRSIKSHYIYASRQLFINSFLDDAIQDNRTLALISAYKDRDPEINRASYILHSEDSAREYVINNYQKFAALCRRSLREYKNYIGGQKINGKNIAIVDTITGAASALKLLEAALPQRRISSFFWICLESARQYAAKFDIRTFSAYCNHKHIATWDIIEYIMAAPEYPVLKIEKNQVVYKPEVSDEERERAERYNEISDASVAFAGYFHKYFAGVVEPRESFIVDWINLIFDSNSGYDRKYLGSIKVCADSAHNITRPIYKKWAPLTPAAKKSAPGTNELIRQQFDDLKIFMNRLIEKKLSTMVMHQNTFLPFKNKHRGQDIVILASGLTLKYFKPLKNCVYIGVNKSFAARKAPLDYLFIQDFSGATPGYINKVKSLDCVKFYGLTCEDTFPERTIPEDLRLDAGAYPYRADWENIPNFQTEFAYDLSTQSLGCGGTVVFPALQFALWTNPRRIYLVGADTSCAGYFDGKGKNFLVPDRLLPLYRKFKAFARQYYPCTEIISVNPVGLKGIFKDIYTDEYLQAVDKQE